MTNRIDRLTDRGLVRREADPDDRRGVQVILTETGLARVDAALSDLLRHEEELLAGLTVVQQETLAALLRALVIGFDNAE